MTYVKHSEPIFRCSFRLKENSEHLFSIKYSKFSNPPSTFKGQKIKHQLSSKSIKIIIPKKLINQKKK